MLKIVIASTNPVKINATLKGFSLVYPHQQIKHQSLKADSQVSDQPMTDTETLQGAINRAHHVSDLVPQADYWIGLEGGVHQINKQYHSFAWVAIKSSSALEFSRTASFSLPPAVTQLIDQGLELGLAIDQVYGLTDTKHSSGAIGILTHNLITRTSLYIPAVTIALTRLRSESSPFD